MADAGPPFAFEQTTAAGWERRGFNSHRRFIEAAASGSAGGRLIEQPGLWAAIVPARPDRSLFNSVAYEDPAALERAYPQLEAAYREAGVEAWTVWVPEGDRASAAMLERAGHHFDGAPQAMALDLTAPAVPAAGAAAAGDEGDAELAITDSGDWRELCSINDAAYEHRPGTFVDGLGPDGTGFRVYAARSQGWIAAGLATLDTDGDCGICIVATLPEARGRGLAGRLMARALDDARERGCETSTLVASAAGRPVYTRLGYRALGAVEMWEMRRPAG